jgi:hypothetical protein
MMAVGMTSRKSNEVSFAQGMFAILVYEREFPRKHKDKLVLALMPVSQGRH